MRARDEIPLVDLVAQHASIRDEVRAAWDEALGTMRLVLGPNCEAFDTEFAAFCGARHAVGVASGTDAVHLALRAMGVGPGDEVITVSYTFFASIEAILYLGARPVLVDVDPATALMDVDQALAAVGPRTRAIMPVHLYGRTVPLEGLLESGVAVVEDACQAHGAALDVGGRAGSAGAASAFSFYMSKNLSAYGEAGSVTTNDDEAARQIRLLRNHGQPNRYESVMVGYNARLDELQAAVLRIKLRRLAAWNERRRQIAAMYDERLKSLEIGLPPLPKGEEHVFHLYVIRVPRRDDLRRHLSEQGISTGVHYPIPCHLQPALSELDYPRGSLPTTERLAEESLSLPMYPELTDDQIERVARSIRDFFR